MILFQQLFVAFLRCFDMDFKFIKRFANFYVFWPSVETWMTILTAWLVCNDEGDQLDIVVLYLSIPFHYRCTGYLLNSVFNLRLF